MPDDRPAPPSPSRDRPDRGGWQWRLAATVCVGLAAGFATAWLLGFDLRSVQTGIVAALTFAAGCVGPLRTAVPVAFVLGVVVVAYSSLGALTTGHALAAAVAMAFVAFTTSVLTAAVPVGLLVGLVASYAYWLVTGIGVIEHRMLGHDPGEVGVLGLLGLAVGLALVAARAGVEQAIGTARPLPPGPRPALWDPIVRSVRTFDEHAKDGVRRAIALGVTMFVFQTLRTHDAYWVMLTVFVILGPKGRPTVSLALGRVSGTLFGVLAVVGVAQLLPESVNAVLAVVCLALSLVTCTRSTTVSAAFSAVSAAVLVALPTGDFAQYAAARLIDTVIGAAVALACAWLVWPRSGGSTAVPQGLAADASQAGLARV